MAVLTGISGFSGTITDGKGGNTPLDLATRVLGFLQDRGITWKIATPVDPRQANLGSVTYRIPEILKTEDYTQGGQHGGRFQNIAAGDITITIDTRRWTGVEYEEFDYSRLGDMAYIVGAAISSIGASIDLDLNAHFWAFLVEKFRPNDDGALTAGELRDQNIILPNLEKENATIDETKADIIKLQRFMTKISKTYNNVALGIPKSSFLVVLDPVCDVNIRNVYWNQPNALGQRVIAKDLIGQQLGNGITYTLDNMLGNNIPKGTSFSKDKDLKTTDFVGFIIHNEAIAMPMNIRSAWQTRNPENMNTRFMCKYQFGIGFVRPWLCFSITKVAPKAKAGVVPNKKSVFNKKPQLDFEGA